MTEDQPTLWGRIPPYQRHSPTSRAAAASKVPDVSGERGRVLAWLQTFGAATDERLQEALPMGANTASR